MNLFRNPNRFSKKTRDIRVTSHFYCPNRASPSTVPLPSCRGGVEPNYGSDRMSLPSPGVRSAILAGLQRSIRIHATDRVPLKNDDLPLSYEDDGPTNEWKMRSTP